MAKCRMVLAFTVILVGICLCSCKIEKISSKKTKDVEYTIVPENEIPQEVKKVIDEKKGSEFKLAYTDPEYTYILIGYGKQDYQGYSRNYMKQQIQYMYKLNLKVLKNIQIYNQKHFRT